MTVERESAQFLLRLGRDRKRCGGHSDVRRVSDDDLIVSCRDVDDQDHIKLGIVAAVGKVVVLMGSRSRSI